MPSRFQKQFDELLRQAEKIEAGKRQERAIHIEGTYVNAEELLNWTVKVRNLLTTLCGADSQHFKAFEKADKATYVGDTNYGIFTRLRPIFLAAKQDFEGGYLNSLKHLVQAELFDSELEQAGELLASGYTTAAAVIAGVVVETALREMCAEKGIEIGNLNKMNADLTKAGVYNKLRAKQITWIADIRNNAAHGNSDEYTKEDVTSMIRDVQALLAERTS